MSRTNHPRIPGTHRAGHIKALNCAGCGYCDPRPVLPAHVAIEEGLAEMALAQPVFKVGLKTMPWSWGPARDDAWYSECPCGVEFEVVDGCYADNFGVYCSHACLVEHGADHLDALTRILVNRDGSSGWDDENAMADWEYDLMGYEHSTGVTHDEYLVEYDRRKSSEPTLVWSSEFDAEAEREEAEAEAERERMRAEDDEDTTGDVAFEGAWLPVVPLYDPTGKTGREDAYSIFGDAFIVEGPSYGERPATKTSRDEWTVTSLARAWDMETRSMVALLRAYGEHVTSGSQRVPMHTIMAAQERRWDYHHADGTPITHGELMADEFLSQPSRKPDAKQRTRSSLGAMLRREERMARGYAELAQTSGQFRTRPVRVTVAADLNPWGERTYPSPQPGRNLRPGAPRPGNNPFLVRR